MAEVVIQSGTRDELAGVTVGSGNVWVRPGHHVVSVELALPDARVVLAVGDCVEVGGSRCTLERIEAVPSIGAHRLHFRTEPATSSPTPGTALPRPSPGADGDQLVAVAVTAPDGNPATGLRRASGALLALLGADVAPASDAWSRDERDEWVEIDRVPCGPNTTTTWTWVGDDGREPGGAVSRAEVVEAVVRWSVDDVHDIRWSGTWRHGAERLLVSLSGTGADRRLRVTGPARVIDPAVGITLTHWGLGPEGVPPPEALR